MIRLEAQASLGVIPSDAGEDIKSGCSVDKLDFDRLRKETDIVGYPILPLIRQLEGMCEGDSGRYLVRTNINCPECADIFNIGERLPKT